MRWTRATCSAPSASNTRPRRCWALRSPSPCSSRSVSARCSRRCAHATNHATRWLPRNCACSAGWRASTSCAAPVKVRAISIIAVSCRCPPRRNRCGRWRRITWNCAMPLPNRRLNGFVRSCGPFAISIRAVWSNDVGRDHVSRRLAMSRRVLFVSVLGALALGGCATIPQPLQGNYAPVSLESARSGTASSAPVRWGGQIIQTEPREQQTCFYVLAEPLDSQARPDRSSEEGLGRFVACKQGFYDPEVFAKGREITVTGSLDGTVQHKIGEYDYTYPRVAAN